MEHTQPILEVKGLSTSFFTENGEVRAVDHISFDVYPGKTLGIVGESGCGKSVTSLSILRLLPDTGKITSGEILYRGKNLRSLSRDAMRRLSGKNISMVFQEPMTALNPVFTVGNQIIEAIRVHESVSVREARKRAIDMLAAVGVPSPEKRIDDYPHQLSGGMRQRVMIAMALSCSPDVLIADEPTTALDVTIQAQILDLLKELQQKFKMGIILITHDLGVVAETCDDVVVMYAGTIVEKGTAQQIFEKPRHPYTQGLLRSIPSYVDGPHQRSRLETIPGIVPSLLELKPGCRFQDRCTFVKEECRGVEPDLRDRGSDHWARCVLE